MVICLADGHRLPGSRPVFWGIKHFNGGVGKFEWRLSSRRYTNANDAVRECLQRDASDEELLYNLGRSRPEATRLFNQLKQHVPIK
jgi:hypothetical protein